MHSFTGIYANIHVNSLTPPGSGALLPNNVFTPHEAFIQHLSKEWTISSMMYAIMRTGDPSLSVAPQDVGHLENMQVTVASVTSFCFRKHLPPISMWNGGTTTWDSYFLMHTGRWYNNVITKPLPYRSPPLPSCPSCRMQTSAGIIKVFLYSTDQGLTLWPFPPLDLNDLSSGAERPEY